MWLQNWQFSQRAQNLYLGGNTFVVSGKYNHDFCWDSTVMILLLTEKPPWVLFGWTKIAQSGSEALQEGDRIWPPASPASSSPPAPPPLSILHYTSALASSGLLVLLVLLLHLAFFSSITTASPPSTPDCPASHDTSASLYSPIGHHGPVSPSYSS